MIRLQIFEGVQAKEMKTFESGPLVIGSQRQADLTISGLSIGGCHAQIVQRAGGYFVADQGFLAGSRVNGRLVHDYGPLSAGDEIACGRWRFRVDAIDLPAAPNRAPAAALQTAEIAVSSAQAPTTAAGVSMETAVQRLRSVLDSRRRDWGEMSDKALRDETLALIESELASELSDMPAEAARAFCFDLVAELVGFGPIERLMQDAEVSEIMVNGPSKIFIEKQGLCQPSGLVFSGADGLRRVIERIFLPLGRRIDDGSPMADGRLPDGSRVNAVLSPPAIEGHSLTIRRFSHATIDLEGLCARGALSEEMRDFLTEAVAAKRNIVVTGGTGSGKTTLLKALARKIPSHERLITIEDAAELRLEAPNLVALEAREPNQEGQGAITIRDLVRNALRMRPDRIVVGECRGGEALDMLQAMNTGHEGSLTTVHANTPRDALARIEVMVLMAGFDLPLKAIREQIAASIQLVVHQQRSGHGGRRVQQICAVTGLESGVLQLETLFSWSEGRYINHALAEPSPDILNWGTR
ncbi:MAG: ATPase, T2SS/T4P/T4SS family [Burkholderiaceae bacterium]